MSGGRMSAERLAQIRDWVDPYHGNHWPNLPPIRQLAWAVRELLTERDALAAAAAAEETIR